MITHILAAWLAMFTLRQIPDVRGTILPQLIAVSIATGIVVTLLFGVLGGSYPAYRGANLLPAEAIHEE